MRKLGSIENSADFMLAVMNGADVNGTWKGEPLVQYLFTECMRKILCSPLSVPTSEMQRLHILLCAGADPSPLFSSPYETYKIDNLLRIVTHLLTVLSYIEENIQAQHFIAEKPALTEKRKELQKRLDTLRPLLKEENNELLENHI